MDVDQDLFVVVSWEEYSQSFTSILQLERGGINHDYDPSTQEAPVVQSQFSVTFRLPLPPPRLPVQWGYALLADSPTEASLHMVPDWNLGAREEELHSCIFNLKTKKCKRVLPPHTGKYGGHVVSLGAHTYFFAQPCKDPNTAPVPVLERYDHLRDAWDKLEPIPQDFNDGIFIGTILGSAVWDDTILLNLFESQFCAYNVTQKKWYQVMFNKPNKPWDYGIEGEAIVIGDTIYALSRKHFSSIAVLSIRKVENNDDLVYKCSLLKMIKVPGEEDVEFDYADECEMSRHLVHLGEDNFCLVHSCQSDIEEYRHIQLTHMKLNINRKGKNSVTVTNKSVHQFKLEPNLNAQFQVRHCFSLPKRKTTDLKQGQTSFEFDPFPESFFSRLAPKPSHAYEKASLASTLGVGAAPERSNTDEEGHSMCVVKFSSVVTPRELVHVLKRFGPIRKVRINVPRNTMVQRKPCAYVEFESAAAKRLAIEASPTTIGGRRAVIQNIRRNVGVFDACEGDLSDTAEAAAVVAPQPVSAFGNVNAFVKQYYHILHHSPALVHQFYQDTSVLVRPEDDGSLSVTTTVKAINEKILSLNYGDFRAELKSVDAQESFCGVVQVFVTGYLTGIDNRIRNFSQCFLLAPQDDQGFFVLNDTFRYVESGSEPHGEQVLVDDVKVEDPVSQEQSSVPPAVQESYVSDEGNHVDEVTEGQVLNPPENGDVPTVEEEVKEVVDEVQDDPPPVV